MQVEDALSGLYHDVDRRRISLGDALKLARFNSDATEMEGWIDEKKKRIQIETERQAKLTSIEDKMKRLQKHQVRKFFSHIGAETKSLLNFNIFRLLKLNWQQMHRALSKYAEMLESYLQNLLLMREM